MFDFVARFMHFLGIEEILLLLRYRSLSATSTTTWTVWPPPTMSPRSRTSSTAGRPPRASTSSRWTSEASHSSSSMLAGRGRSDNVGIRYGASKNTTAPNNRYSTYKSQGTLSFRCSILSPPSYSSLPPPSLTKDCSRTTRPTGCGRPSTFLSRSSTSPALQGCPSYSSSTRWTSCRKRYVAH